MIKKKIIRTQSGIQHGEFTAEEKRSIEKKPITSTNLIGDVMFFHQSDEPKPGKDSERIYFDSDDAYKNHLANRKLLDN